MKRRRTEAQRFVGAVLAKEMVCWLSSELAPSGIPVMPIKGVLLQQLLYRDPAERELSDVDVLVPEWAWETTARMLQARGLRRRNASRSLVEDSFEAPSGMRLDLHRRLFAAGRFGMSTSAVFARSRPDDEMFGAPVRLMSPDDLYAHLLGKLASDHVSCADERRFVELASVAAALRLNPTSTCSRLVLCGLARAARYALPITVDVADDAFAAEVLDLLPADPLGSTIAAACRRGFGAASARSPIAAVSAHLLNSSIPSALLSSSLAAVNRVRGPLVARLATR